MSAPVFALRRPHGRLGLAALALVLLAAVLRAPALTHGVHLDDLAQLAMLEGVYPVPRAPWDLFRFSSGEPSEVATLVAHGNLAWWSAADLRFAALRPLSSLLTALDLALFGRAPLWHHLHSFAWWFALLAGYAHVTRRWLGPGLGLLALALVALDESAGVPLAWLANRNVLVSAVFGLGAVALHVRARRGGRVSWAAAMWLALSLAGGEYGLLAAAYILAHALVPGPEPWRDRLRALAPSLLVLGIYVALHRAGGYGARGSGVYLDPIAEPAAFLAAAAWRVPALWAQLLLAWPVEGLAMAESGRALRAGVGLLAAVAFVSAVWRSTPVGAKRREAAWLLLGTALATVPLAGSFVSARLLLIPQLAVAPLLARLLAAGWRAGRGWRGAATLLAALHLLWAPARGTWELVHAARLDAANTRALAARDPGAPPWQGRHVILVAAADSGTLLYAPYVRWLHGAGLPASFLVLSQAPHALELTRPGPRTLELALVGGAMLGTPAERLFRAADRPLGPGATVDLGHGRVEVRVAEGGRPRRIRLELDAPLEDPRHLLLIAGPRGLVPYPPPPEGASVTLPPPPVPLRLE